MNFYKYQGCGNDFVLLDGRIEEYNLSETTIKSICDRRFGIGADGLMILERRDSFDFAMKYYNSDGRASSFCGNGGRCIVQFAQDLEIIKDHASFLYESDAYSATILNNLISLNMRNVEKIVCNHDHCIVDTGSPHYVHFTNDVLNFDLIPFARSIRYSTEFPNGINVSIVEIKSENSIRMRTYERGVEDETYSCGTGVVAAALSLHNKESAIKSPLNVITIGGEFIVEYIFENERYQNIKLIGPARFVFKGEIEI